MVTVNVIKESGYHKLTHVNVAGINLYPSEKVKTKTLDEIIIYTQRLLWFMDEGSKYELLIKHL